MFLAMVRVLQIMGGLNRGGLETFVMNIYRAIDKTKIQFDFLVNSRGDYAEEIESLGGHIFLSPARNKGYRKYKKDLNCFFKKNSHHYVACHVHVSSLSSILPIECAEKYHIPVRILHAHSSSISKTVNKRWLHLLFHYIHKFKVRKVATHYFGCSQKALDWLYCSTGVRRKAELIKNGIAVSDYIFNSRISSEVRRELGFSDNDIVLGHVGRFIPLKNHKFIVDVFKELHKQNENSKLLLIGEGETEETIKQQVSQYNLTEHVRFMGVRSDVNVLLQAVDCFVMPSWFEGMPVALIEAQASGCYVVASDTISKDSKLTDDFVFLSITQEADLWANTILKGVVNRTKPNNELLIKQAGFDSHSTAIMLSNVYLNRF